MRSFRLLIYLGLLSGAGLTLRAQLPDLLVPAGTLMQCTLNEPDFSSATASPGDPFLCYPSSLQEFGQSVFPRGSYLVGHFESSREPGRFFGKGNLLLTVDRLGLPSADLPLVAKVIAVAGFRVDRTGAIQGKGHAERDVVEWMLPPLWPWKLVMLPARGPRPELRGEVRLTLRVMEDLTVPQLADARRPLLPAGPGPAQPRPGWRYFGQPSGLSLPATAGPDPRAVNISAESGAPDSAASLDPGTASWPAGVTLLVSRDGAVIPVGLYQRAGDQIVFHLAADDSANALPVDQIDWSATAHVNAARHVRVTLRSAPVTDTQP